MPSAEGTHYKIEDGCYVSLNDPINPGYLQSASGLTPYLYREDFKHYSKDYQWALDYERNRMAMSEVNSQYTWPLLRGTMPNPLEVLKDVNRRLDDAGRQEVVRRTIEQYQAYLDGLGIPK